MAFIRIPMNAARICDGLSKIGYTPSSAICDITDNAAAAKANHVYIKIIPERILSENRIDNVKEYLIIDDGNGMDREGITQALELGAPDDNYEEHSLSKFGLGLKSAAFSQGEVLEVISSTGKEDFIKFRVSLPDIRERGEYGADEVELSVEDLELISIYLPQERGTIIRITEVRKNRHPSIKDTLKELREKIGVIYYYIMQDDFHVIINDDECLPFDVLFADEANVNGNLDEFEWDGRTTRWIQKPTAITVDAEKGTTVQVEATQLPHPPTFALDGSSRRQEVREKYRIEANNYGYYVYRNKRLLSWCESLDMIPRDQDFYAFRGRILIDDTADDIFNIDVKKSHLHLSGEAFKAIDDITYEYKRKSKKAWINAKEEIKRRTEGDGLMVANTLAQQIEVAPELPGMVETEQEYKAAQERKKEMEVEQKKKIKKLIAQVENEPDIAEEEEQEKQEQTVIEGKEAGPKDKIFQVPYTTDNVLWEPYMDTDKGACVRLNRLHRFIRVIYENNSKNGALQTIIGLLFLQFAGAEYYTQTRFAKYKREQIAEILEEYRRVCSEYLIKMCRDLEDNLPGE